MTPTYYLKAEWQKRFSKVTEEQFIRAERDAGFYPKTPGTVATGGFSGNGMVGKINYPVIDEETPKKKKK